MSFFSFEVAVVLRSLDFVLFSLSVKACGVQRRGSCSYDYCIVYVLDGTMCRII